MTTLLHCHCPAFAGMHYETQMCKTLRRLKREAIADHVNARADEGPDDCDEHHRKTDDMTDEQYKRYMGE